MASHTLQDLEVFGISSANMHEIINETYRVCQYGAHKYGYKSWHTATSPASNLLAVNRHIFQPFEGCITDEDTQEHPLAHAMTRLLFARTLLLRNQSLFHI